MRAIVHHKYGPPDSPDVLELRDVDTPPLTEDGVLVRVRASSVNRAEWYAVTGTPYAGRVVMGLRKPKRDVPGVDFAGTVEAVGSSVTEFRLGDDVFGARSGALAEYVCVRKAVVPKPANLTFEQAAAVPTAAVTALQGLRDQGQIRPGQKVLINGASGGVGTFAVQLAKAFGAEVTGVCSTRNVDLVHSLGADHVVDYTQEDFTRSGQRYDLLFDVAGSRSWSECRRVLADKAIVVIAGAPKGNRWIGPLGHLAKVLLASLGASQKVVFFIAKFNREDLAVLQELLAAGKVTPVIDRRYTLREVPAALRYLGEGHAQGKVVITV
ncbi:MAG: NAD(P)-dependent alcohol dehydrogenase [Chloroflexi bacterium]|nr:NAD(P)-dependent alcohol dehydrogenase [Chloroflexota bacterium]